jgi:hypothetical protein
VATPSLSFWPARLLPKQAEFSTLKRCGIFSSDRAPWQIAQKNPKNFLFFVHFANRLFLFYLL